MPPQRVALRCYLQAQVVMLPSGKRPGDVKAYCLFPRSQTRKGGCIMKLEEVLQLFVIVGGTVGITFQIAWAIFPHIGTETRSKLLREAAVRNIGQWSAD